VGENVAHEPDFLGDEIQGVLVMIERPQQRGDTILED